MDTKEISLEMSHGGDYAIPETVGKESREPDYPAFTYSGKEELDLPDEGEMTIKFRKISETSSVNKKGEHHYECRIEVQSICDVEGEGEPDEMYSAGASKDTGDALDKIKSLLEKHESEE